MIKHPRWQQVGAEVGVGLVEGIHEGTNWKLFLRTVCAWVRLLDPMLACRGLTLALPALQGMTLIIAGSLSAAIFSFGASALLIRHEGAARCVGHTF